MTDITDIEHHDNNKQTIHYQNDIVIANMLINMYSDKLINKIQQVSSKEARIKDQSAKILAFHEENELLKKELANLRDAFEKYKNYFGVSYLVIEFNNKINNFIINFDVDFNNNINDIKDKLNNDIINNLNSLNEGFVHQRVYLKNLYLNKINELKITNKNIIPEFKNIDLDKEIIMKIIDEHKRLNDFVKIKSIEFDNFNNKNIEIIELYNTLRAKLIYHIGLYTKININDIENIENSNDTSFLNISESSFSSSMYH
jgi:hypothetical protein